MKSTKKGNLIIYMLCAFGIAWVLQIAAGLMFRAGNAGMYSALLSISMFAPLLAAIISGAGLRGMGWKPRIKGNVKWIAATWFVPAVLGTVGAALYFLLVPDALDTSLSYITAALGADAIHQMEGSGISVSR